jgi:site-specific recombinase XerD
MYRCFSERSREEVHVASANARDIWEQIARWAATLADDEGLDPKTAALYGHAARRYATWLHAHRRAVAAAAATVDDARAYREALLACGLAPGTINRSLPALHLFFDRTVSGGATPNPFTEVPLVPRR